MLALIMLVALPLMMVVVAALTVAAQVVFTRLRRRCRKDCRGQKQVSLHSSHAFGRLNARRFGDEVTLRGLDYARVMEEEEEVQPYA
jgi:hypothetical protein